MDGSSTNRERAAPFRGHRHYFKRPTKIALWKVRLAVVALLAVGTWVVAGMATKESTYADSTHGPLTQAHSSWESRCDACHTPFGSEGNKAGGLFETHERWRAFRCESCHAGPASDPKNYSPHYSASSPASKDAMARDCSSCHRDHQGRDFSLVHLNDSTCVRCHKDLNQFHPGASPGHSITSFHGDHPEFQPVRKAGEYRRTMKFSHALHMSPGVSHSAADAEKNGLTLEKLPEKYREQYRSFGGDQKALQLDCAACHQLDSTPNGGGEYYSTVTFTKHCQACHSMEVSGVKSDAGITLKKFDVPHGQQPSELDRFVRGEIARQVLADAKVKLAPPLPSDRLDSPRELPVPPEIKKELDSLVVKVNELLYDLPTSPKEAPPGFPRSAIRGGHQCLKCHDHEPGITAFDPPKSIVRPDVPAVWLPGGRFNHSAHRTVNCAQCHTDKSAAFISPADRVVKEPLAIPGIDNCKQCHKPATHGGVKDSCVDCHRYHGAAAARRLP